MANKAKKTKRRKHKKDFGGVKKLKSVSLKLGDKRFTLKLGDKRSRSVSQPSISRKKPKNLSALESKVPDKSKYTDDGWEYLKLLKEKKASVLSDIEQVAKLDKAIEYVKVKYSQEFISNSKIEEKITKLSSQDAIIHRQSYIEAIFKETDKKKDLKLKNHREALVEWKKFSQLKSVHEIRINYLLNVETKQKEALDTISNQEFKTYYSNLTTPLYVKIVEFNSSLKTDILEEFQKYVVDEKKYWRDAICHVFVDDLTTMLNIHLGIWRQLFNDGHLLMVTSWVPLTIETCGKNNAYKLPSDGSNYFCPGCMEKIGNKTDDEDKFVKSGIKSAVDHIDPVKHAFTTYSDTAMCHQLALTCRRCNSKKSDMSIRKFIHAICTNKKPVHLFDDSTASNLTGAQFGERKEWYIDTHKETIALGVNTFEKILEHAHMLQETYYTITSFKENLIKQALGLVEIVDTVPALFGLRNVDLATPEELYEMFRTLVIICVGDIELSYEFPDDTSALPTPGTSFINMIHNSTHTYNEHGITLKSLIAFFQYMADRPIVTITKYDYHKFSIILARFLFHYLEIEERKGIIEFDVFKKLCNSIIESNKVSKVKTSPFIGDSATDYSKDLKFKYSPMGQGEGKIKKQKIYKIKTRKSIRTT